MTVPVKIFCIPREDVLDYWPRVYPWLDRAYAKTGNPMPETCRDDLLQGHKQLWVAWAPEGRLLCAVLTRLAKMRDGLHGQVVAAGGVEVDRWIFGMTTIEQWAKDEGCVKVTVQGRPGWAKLLQDYRRTQVVMERQL
jgi:hypothetical protein